MRIGEIANRSGVTVDTVRFYERLGVLPKAARESSGYRDYSPETVERIRLTREFQAIGLTLNEVIDALAAHDAGGATCESERWRLDAVLERVDAKLAELGDLRGRIVDTQEACAGDGAGSRRQLPRARCGRQRSEATNRRTSGCGAEAISRLWQGPTTPPSAARSTRAGPVAILVT